MDACEEAFRSKAIEIVRGTEKVPWGKALLRVLREEAAIWLQFRGILVLKHTPPPNGHRFGNVAAVLDTSKGGGKGARTRARISPARHLPQRSLTASFA